MYRIQLISHHHHQQNRKTLGTEQNRPDDIQFIDGQSGYSEGDVLATDTSGWKTPEIEARHPKWGARRTKRIINQIEGESNLKTDEVHTKCDKNFGNFKTGN